MSTAGTGAPPQQALEVGGYVVGIGFAADGTVAVGTGAGKTVYVSGAATAAAIRGEVVVHRGAALSFVRDPAGDAFLSGGDDGRLVRVGADGALSEVFDTRGKWIEALAINTNRRLVAAAAGRQVHLIKSDRIHDLGPHPSTVMDVTFSPDGSRLAAAHYGGVSIHLTDKPGEKPKPLNWKGSHLGLRYSPNAKFLATATQENAIHVWRLASGADMQMQGYLTKVKSLAWTWDSNWLVSSGAEIAVCWGFAGKGPEGSPPLELNTHSVGATVAQVAAHPSAPFVALGFSHGAIEIADLEKKRVLPLAAAIDSPVTAIAWSPDGWRIAAGSESGVLRLIDLRPRS
ncbi:MAG: WD40 repeat domain-containing protein [Alphaproteobacteria bacterium]|nr:WD40 repeat domain-containing protein [Alphaproteobacteria bacterium]